jgi:hypothetical protein
MIIPIINGREEENMLVLVVSDLGADLGVEVTA